MLNQFQHRSFGWWLLLLPLLFACKKDQPLSWDVEALVPVAHGRLDLSDLLPDSLLVIDADGLLHLAYESDWIELPLDSLVALPDTAIINSFSPPFTGGPFSIPAGSNLISLNEDIVLDAEPAQLRLVRFSEGTLRYALRSYVDGLLDVSYELPGVNQNGTSFFLETTTGPGFPGDPWEQTGELDLAGVELMLTGGSGIGVNSVVSIMSVNASSTVSEPLIVFGEDSVAIELEFVDAKIEYARGYFGDYTSNLDESFVLNSAVSAQENGLVFPGFFFHLEMENYFGADARLYVNEIEGLGANSVFLEHNDFTGPFNVTRAWDNDGTVVPTGLDIEMNADNSNIVDWISNVPDSARLQIDFELNPLGDVSGGNDFFYSDFPPRVRYNLDIPLCITAQNFSLTDTLFIQDELEFPSSSGLLHLYASNSFPFSFNVALQLYDSTDVFVTQIPIMESVQAGLFSSLQEPNITTNSHVTFQLEDGLLETLKVGSYFLITATLNSFGQQEVKLNGTEFIEVKIVADMKTEIEF
jgi:hypothetical protein